MAQVAFLADEITVKMLAGPKNNSIEHISDLGRFMALAYET